MERPLFLIFVGAIVFLYGCQNPAQDTSVPVIYSTDFYHPHCDPDDHFDLATVYGLAKKGQMDIDIIIMNYPRIDLASDEWCAKGDPDITGLSQLNQLSGIAVPSMVGTPTRMETDLKDLKGAPLINRAGIDAIIQSLEKAVEPVVIHITGSTRDVAFTAHERPDLFSKKCRGVYLNAGTALGSSLSEYNVTIDPVSYFELFNLPCPVYWLPCVHQANDKGKIIASKGENSSWWAFRQTDILPGLSEPLQKFFLYMFRDGFYTQLQKNFDFQWMRYLSDSVESDLLEEQNQLVRNMWCTAGFLHSVGETIDLDGEIVPLADVADQALFSFEPIRVDSITNQTIHWTPARESNRYILKIHDRSQYDKLMEKALKEILTVL